MSFRQAKLLVVTGQVTSLKCTDGFGHRLKLGVVPPSVSLTD